MLNVRLNNDRKQCLNLGMQPHKKLLPDGVGSTGTMMMNDVNFVHAFSYEPNFIVEFE